MRFATSSKGKSIGTSAQLVLAKIGSQVATVSMMVLGTLLSFYLAGCDSAQNTAFNALNSLVGASVTIDSPKDGSALNASAPSLLVVNGQCGFDGQPVKLQLADQAVSTTCNNLKWMVTFPQAGLSDGLVSISATHGDTNGNKAIAQIKLKKKTSLPVMAVTQPVSGSQLTLDSKYHMTVSGNCTENGQAITITGDGSGATTCQNGAFSAVIDFTGYAQNNAFGKAQIVFSIVDYAQNTASTTVAFGLNQPLPTLSLDSSLLWINSVNQSNYLLFGTCSAFGQTISIQNSGLQPSPSALCNVDGTWSTNVNLSSLSDGPVVLVFSHSSAQGASTKLTSNLQKKTTPANVHFSSNGSPASGATVGNQVNLAGTCETSGGSVSLSYASLTNGIAGAYSIPSILICTNGSFASTVQLPIADGSVQFRVTQTDQAGNSGQDLLLVLKDTSAPVLQITAPQNGTAVKGQVSVAGTCNSSSSISLTVTDVSSGAVQPSQSLPCANGAFGSTVNLPSPDGQKKIAVVATKASNGASASDSVTVQMLTNAPVLTETKQGSTPVYTVASTITLGGACSNNVAITLPSSGTLPFGAVNPPVSVPCTAQAWSYSVQDPGVDGNYTYLIDSQDAAGNKAPQITRVWYRQTTPPVVAISSPSASSYVGATFAVAGTCQSGINLVLKASGDQGALVSLASGASLACVNSKFSLSLVVGGNSPVNQNINISLTQSNQAGAVSTPATLTLKFDNASANLAFDTPTTSYVNLSSVTAAFVSGTCSAVGQPVVLNATDSAGTKLTKSPACSSAGKFNTSFDFSAMADGAINIQGSLTTLTGLSTSANLALNKATISPVVKFDSSLATLQINTKNNTAVKIFGTCTFGSAVVAQAQVVTLLINGTSQSVPCTLASASASGTFSVTQDFSSGSYAGFTGSISLSAALTDLAGNKALGDLVAINIDNSIPVLTVSNSGKTLAADSQTFQGTCSSGATINIASSSQAAIAPITCNSNGTFTFQTSPQTTDGTFSYALTETRNGNSATPATATWTRLRTPPVLTITAPMAADASTASASGVSYTGTGVVASGATGSTITITGTCSVANVSIVDNGAPAQNVNCTIPAGSKTGTFTYTTTAQSNNQTYNYVISEADSVNNTATLKLAWVRNAAGPSIQFTAPVTGFATQSLAEASPYITGLSALTVSFNCDPGTALQIAPVANIANPAPSCTNPLSLQLNLNLPPTCPQPVGTATQGKVNVTYSLSGCDSYIDLKVTATNTSTKFSTSSYLAINYSTKPPVLALDTSFTSGVLFNVSTVSSPVVTTGQNNFGQSAYKPAATFLYTSFPIKGTCSGPGDSITFTASAAGQVNIAGSKPAVNNIICPQNGNWSTTLDFTNQIDGQFTVTATEKALNGTIASATTSTIAKFTTLPQVTVQVDPSTNHTTIPFTYTGAVQTYAIPSGVNNITVQTYGAWGGGWTSATSYQLPSNYISYGGAVITTLKPEAGAKLSIKVGGRGGTGVGSSSYYSNYGYGAGGGGGRSQVDYVNSTSTSVLQVAGGGGGAAWYGAITNCAYNYGYNNVWGWNGTSIGQPVYVYCASGNPGVSAVASASAPVGTAPQLSYGGQTYSGQYQGGDAYDGAGTSNVGTNYIGTGGWPNGGNAGNYNGNPVGGGGDGYWGGNGGAYANAGGNGGSNYVAATVGPVTPIVVQNSVLSYTMFPSYLWAFADYAKYPETGNGLVLVQYTILDPTNAANFVISGTCTATYTNGALNLITISFSGQTVYTTCSSSGTWLQSINLSKTYPGSQVTFVVSETDGFNNGSSSQQLVQNSAAVYLSCADALNNYGQTTDGNYWVGTGYGSATNVYCDMTHDGGGWMLVKRGTSAEQVSLTSAQYPTTLPAGLPTGTYKLADSATNSFITSASVYRVVADGDVTFTRFVPVTVNYSENVQAIVNSYSDPGTSSDPLTNYGTSSRVIPTAAASSYTGAFIYNGAKTTSYNYGIGNRGGIADGVYFSTTLSNTSAYPSYTDFMLSDGKGNVCGGYDFYVWPYGYKDATCGYRLWVR